MTSTVLRDSRHPSLLRPTPFSNDEWFDRDQLAEMRAYFRPLRRLKLVSSLVSFAVLVAFTFGDVAVELLDRVDVSGWFLQLVVVIMGLTLVSTLVDLPFTAFVQLGYDKRHGLSNMTPRQLTVDTVKDALINIVLEAALFGVVFAAIRAFDLWWLYAWAAFMALQAVLVFVYPVLILPRFNKLTPLAGGELRDRIEAVARLAGTEIEGIYTMDASKRSRRGNAAVAGWGKTKRVLLFDTILEMPSESIAQVVAHEIGHYRLKHTLTTLPFAGLLVFASFLVVDAVASSETVLGWAGVDELGEPASLPLFLLVFGLAWGGLGLAQAWWSRYHERAADLEALELLGDPSEFMRVWPRFVTLNKAELEPSRWGRLNRSHPMEGERMQFALAWAELNAVAAERPPTSRLDDPFASARKD